MENKKLNSPWLWVPTLYFAEGIPYFIVNVISVIMFKNMGMSNGDMAMWTGMLYLPWVIKPIWSPLVDLLKTKRWWVVSTQLLMTAAFALIAFCLPKPEAAQMAAGETPVSLFTMTLIFFWITAFASASHDIAADGFYMLALSPGDQSLFVGIRSTFYRLSSIFGQGVLVVIAGLLETKLADIPQAWYLTMLSCSVLFGIIALYNAFLMPRPAADAARSQGVKFSDTARAFSTFFKKKHIWTAVLFMLLFRLPEAFVIKMLNPFLLDPMEKGGLGLATETVGIVYGTVGVLALTIGGILGGIAAAKWGLKKVLWPMTLSLALPCFVYVYLSMAQPANLWIINSCIALDQFGYGFGFTAYMLYMMYFADGEFKTSHYSICTAFMALSMMLPGMVAGHLQECLGYSNFFWMVMLCCLVTVAVTLFVKVDPQYGKK